MPAMAAFGRPSFDCGFEVATEVEDSGAAFVEDGEVGEPEPVEAGVIEEGLAFVVESALDEDEVTAKKVELVAVV